MENKEKMIFNGLITGCGLLLAITVFLFATKASIGREKDDLEAKFAGLSESHAGLQNTIEKLELEKKAIAAKITKLESTARKLSHQLGEEQRDSRKFSNEAKKKEDQLEGLKMDIVALIKDKRQLVNRLELMNKAFDDLKVKFDELIVIAESRSLEHSKELKKKIKELVDKRDSTSLGTVVIR